MIVSALWNKKIVSWYVLANSFIAAPPPPLFFFYDIILIKNMKQVIQDRSEGKVNEEGEEEEFSKLKESWI